MIVVTEANGDTNFWDGVDQAPYRFCQYRPRSQYRRRHHRKRTPTLPLPRDEAFRPPKDYHSQCQEYDREGCRFARFAGRILLTYIYEEASDWDIVRDGVDSLKEAHRRGFKPYMKRAIEIDRVNPKLFDYDIDQIASSLDPSADLDFDYLGVQTMYDRYLIVDKTTKRLCPSRGISVFLDPRFHGSLSTTRKKIAKLTPYDFIIYTRAVVFVLPPPRYSTQALFTRNSPPVIFTKSMIASNPSCTAALLITHFSPNGQVA